MRILLLVLLLSGCAGTPYVKVGVGYKIQESPHYKILDNGWAVEGGDPISARIQTGVENGNWTYGIDHHSQWFSGPPFDNGYEYGKTEVFVDYKWSF